MISQKQQELNEIRYRLSKEMIDLTGEYVNLLAEESTLDGSFHQKN
jgi:hypothetical protein